MRCFAVGLAVALCIRPLFPSLSRSLALTPTRARSGGALFVGGRSQDLECPTSTSSDAKASVRLTDDCWVGPRNMATLAGPVAFWEGPCRPASEAEFFADSTVAAGASGGSGDGPLISSTAARATVQFSPSAHPGLALELAQVVVQDGFGAVVQGQSFLSRVTLRPPTAGAKLVGQVVAGSEQGVYVPVHLWL